MDEESKTLLTSLSELMAEKVQDRSERISYEQGFVDGLNEAIQIISNLMEDM